MNQEKIVQTIKIAIEDYGVKGSFLSNALDISYTFMKQVMNGERNFSEKTIQKASDFFNSHPYFFNV